MSELEGVDVVVKSDSRQDNHSNRANQHKIIQMQSRIGKALFIKGDLGAKEDVLIDGRIEGAIAVKNNHVEIGATGKVEANIFAKQVTIGGEIKGDVYATNHITVTKTGHVYGDIYAPDVSIEDGALLKGKINMDKNDILGHQSLIDESDDHHRGSAFNFLFKKQPEISPDQNNAIFLNDSETSNVSAEANSSIHGIADISSSVSHDRSVIGESVMIKGEIISDEDVILQGGLDGIIYLKNNSVALGPHALVKAKLFVKAMIAQGEVNGDVYAKEQVVLKNPCQYTGNIHSPRISIESGAVVMGELEMEAQDVEKAFETLSGSMFAYAKQGKDDQDNDPDNIATQEGQSASPNGSKDWPIFYPRS